MTQKIYCGCGARVQWRARRRKNKDGKLGPVTGICSKCKKEYEK